MMIIAKNEQHFILPAPPSRRGPDSGIRWLRRCASILPSPSREVGNGAGHLEDAAVGTGGELQALHGHAEHVERGGVGLGKLVEHALGHHGVGVDALEGFEALLLNFTGFNDTLTDIGAGRAGLHLRELGEGYCLYLAVDVDTAGNYRVRFSFVNSCHAN